MTKELLDRYLKEAYRMGQVFWQQADSGFVSQNKKADVTKAKFDQLLIDAGEALAQQEQPAKTERQIRRMFCATYASDSSPYMDDGEAQDNSMHPCIDFLRDSPEQIRSKMIERAIAKHKEQPAQEPVAWLHGTTFQVVVSKNRPDSFSAWLPLFAAPPTQPALSDDEILNCFYASKSEGMTAYMLAVGRAIEAHCRGGNHG